MSVQSQQASLIVGCLLAGFASWPSGLVAQVGIRGRVVADSIGTPVAGAVVTVGGGQVRATTDSGGRFAIRELSPGRTILAVRAIGYRPSVGEVELPSMGMLEVTVTLSRDAQQLEPVEVVGAAPPASGKLIDFERRRAQGIGSFLTRADLAKLDDHAFSTAIRLLRGALLLRRPWLCGGGFAVATARSHQFPPSICAEMYDGYARGCYLSIYVDGVRRYETGDPDPPNIDEFLTERVEAVELYRGPAELPAEYSGTGTICGALFIWTRVSGPGGG